jgi:hypothetical protein
LAARAVTWSRTAALFRSDTALMALRTALWSSASRPAQEADLLGAYPGIGRLVRLDAAELRPPKK